MCVQAVLETVVKITHDKGKKNETQENKYDNIQITYVSIPDDF